MSGEHCDSKTMTANGIEYYIAMINHAASRENFATQKQLWEAFVNASPSQNYQLSSTPDLNRTFNTDAEEAFLNSWKLKDGFVNVVTAQRCEIDSKESWLVVYWMRVGYTALVLTVIYSEGKEPKITVAFCD